MTDTPLRILVVLPLYGGSLPVGRFAAQALKELGHMVEVFESPAFHQGYTALSKLGVAGNRLEYLENSYLQVVGQGVVAKVESFEPDLVFAMAQAPLSRQVLKRLRKDGVPTAMWFVEDYQLFTYWQAFAPFYDLFAVIQKGPFFEELAKAGQNNAMYLPLAAAPAFHAPQDLSPLEKREWGSQVSFMGAGYPNRRMAFRRLLNLDFKIWGNDWEGDMVLKPYIQKDGRRVTPEECVKIFNATDINLNLHSCVDPDTLVSGGDFVNPRTFELASCEAFQLVDERALLPESFEPDEMATFTSLDDLLEKIRYFAANPDERKTMAKRARQRVQAEHTYGHRMQAFLDFAAQRLPDWPKPRSRDTALDGLPPEFRSQVSAMLDELGLTSQASFDDLLTAIKARQGALSELDTALLFLEEWRKQYGSKKAA